MRIQAACGGTGTRLCPSWIFLLALGWTTGCGSTQPSRFYLLTPVPREANSAVVGVSIRLSPVEMPRYLATPEIVTRVSPNELELAAYDRWAEPISDNFTRVLAKNLARLVPTERVTRVPWEGSVPITHSVTVSVSRLDFEAGQAVLEASWGVSTEPNEAGTLNRSRFLQDVAGSDYLHMVQAMSQAVAALSQEIAEEIQRTGN